MKKSGILLLIFSFITNLVFSQSLETIPLQKYSGNQKFITVSIAGKPYNFLFDTGSGLTIISSSVALEAKIKTSGTINTFSSDGHRIEMTKAKDVNINIGKTNLFQKTVAVTESPVSKQKDLPLISGILSLKSFDDRILSLDLSNEILVIESETSFNENKRNLVPFETKFANGINGNELIPFVSTEVNHIQIWLKFDMGNSDKVLVSKQAAHEMKLVNDSLLENTSYTSLGNAPFVFNPYVVENLPAAAKDIIYDGILNYSYISGNTFVFDLKRSIIYIQP